MSRPTDLNQLAHRLVAESVGEAERTDPPEGENSMPMYQAGTVSSIVQGRRKSEQVREPDEVVP